MNFNILHNIALAASKLSSYLKVKESSGDNTANMLAAFVALNAFVSKSPKHLNITDKCSEFKELYTEINTRYNVNLTSDTTPEELVHFIYGVKGLSVYNSLIAIGLDVVSLDFWQLLVDSLTFKPRNNVVQQQVNMGV